MSLDMSTMKELFFVQSLASTCMHLSGNVCWISTSSKVFKVSCSTVQTAENEQNVSHAYDPSDGLFQVIWHERKPPLWEQSPLIFSKFSLI